MDSRLRRGVVDEQPVPSDERGVRLQKPMLVQQDFNPLGGIECRVQIRMPSVREEFILRPPSPVIELEPHVAVRRRPVQFHRQPPIEDEIRDKQTAGSGYGADRLRRVRRPA